MTAKKKHREHIQVTTAITVACVRASIRAGETHCFVPVWTLWPFSEGAVEKEPGDAYAPPRAILNHAAEGGPLYRLCASWGLRATPLYSCFAKDKKTCAARDRLLAAHPMRALGDFDGVLIEWNKEDVPAITAAMEPTVRLAAWDLALDRE
jgi:hypothetical protein